MAQLWFKPTNSNLTMLPLSGQPVCVSVFPPRPAPPRPGTPDPADVILENLRDPRTNEDRWLLFAGAAASVWIDGMPQGLGIYHLADGQEILVKGAGVVVLSTERLPRRDVLPDSGTEVFCPRCKSEIEPGTEAVQCPACGFWHHERDDLPCWTYEHSTHCAMCAQATALDGAFTRLPEGL